MLAYIKYMSYICVANKGKERYGNGKEIQDYGGGKWSLCMECGDG